MGEVNLTIIKPQHNQNFKGESQRRIRFEGAAVSPPPVALFYRWYSNNWAADPRTSPLGTALAFEADLPIGSHAIIFSVKDVAGNTKDDLPLVKHSGMAGGPPNVAPVPCLVHVLIAVMLLPAAGATLSKANSLLSVQAPPQWANPDYQSTTNRLRFRWLFTPEEPANGRQPGEINPNDINKGLDFFKPGEPADDPFKDLPRLRYQGPLPSQLGLGNYLLTLRVQNQDMPGEFDVVSRKVVLTN